MNKEIKLAVSELREALPGLSKVIGKSRTLPVLQSVHVQRNREGVITLQATDLASFLIFTARGLQPGGQAEVLVPMDQLSKAMKCSSPKDEIGIVSEAKDKVKIRYSIAGNLVEQTLATLPLEEFPPLPRVSQPGVQVEPQFGKALKEALECCSDDSSRKVINGACLDVADENFHYIIGTNGRVLFSANSFCFSLQKSVIIPDSKFLDWSDFMDEEPCFLSFEPGKQDDSGGWVRIDTPRWTYVTKEIEGRFPKWKQVVPSVTDKWTRVEFTEDSVKQLLQVVPNLPGAYGPDYPLKLVVENGLLLQGHNEGDEQWTSIPVQNVTVTGSPTSVHLNREYLLKAIRFGLTTLQVQDGLSPLVFSSKGKKLVVMPIRLEGPVSTAAETPAEHSDPKVEPAPQEEPTALPKPEAPTQERTVMPRTSRTPAIEPVVNEDRLAGLQSNGNAAGVKGLLDQVEQMKDTLKGVIRDLNSVIDAVKQAEKEKRTADKEVDAIRAKLRQIQSVAN